MHYVPAGECGDSVAAIEGSFMRTIMLLSFALGAAVPAIAQDNHAANATGAPAEEKKICRRVEETGSIVPLRRVCHTKNEWAAIDHKNEREAGAAFSAMRPNGTPIQRGN
jgi:hypothetical protein